MTAPLVERAQDALAEMYAALRRLDSAVDGMREAVQELIRERGDGVRGAG